MHMKAIGRGCVVLMIAAGGGCAAPQGAAPPDKASGPAVWIDAPLNNAVLPQAEYQVVSHASDRAGVSAIELRVNGKVVKTDTMGGKAAGSLAHISQRWLPEAPGTYVLEVWASNGSGTLGPAAIANVVVGRAGSSSIR